MTETAKTWEPDYERWRHGGWYVGCVSYPSGAVGCVSNNYEDKHWRIACGPWHHITFSSRDDAAKAEYVATEMSKNLLAPLLDVCEEIIADPMFGALPEALCERLKHLVGGAR